jgi:hypothetical protein
MALDTLILGPFVFTDFAVPDQMPFGGKQHMHVQKMPGGARAIDCMGPDDEDVSWSGIFWGDDALSRAQTLDAMRRSGIELPFSWGAQNRTAVIAEFKASVEKFTCVHYSITVVMSDSRAAGSVISSIDDIISGDLSAAMALVQ